MISSIIQAIIKPIIQAIKSIPSVSGPAPMARYKFDETVGTTFVDSIGAVNGTYQGSINLNQTALNNEAGGSVELIADNASWGKITGFDTDEILTSFTISLWVKPAAATIAYRPIIEVLSSDGDERVIGLFLCDGSLAYFPAANIQTETGYHKVRSNGLYGYDTSAARMLTVTFDGSSLKIYDNGVLQNTTAITGSILGSNGTLHIGKDRWAGDNYYQAEALFDDLKIYSSVLTAGEILTEYNNTKI